MDEGWDAVEERVKNLGLHIEVGTKNWLTIILDHAEQIKSERDVAEAKLAVAEADVDSLASHLRKTLDGNCALKAKLAKAVEALEVYADPCDATETTSCGYTGNMCCMTANTALAELKGESDE